MLSMYEPTIEDLWFRQQMLEDPKTMSYNHAWGGTISWPRDRWLEWYDRWVASPHGRRFYRYLKEDATGAFVGEIAYHWEEETGRCLANVIVYASYRGKGYGRDGLRLLCQAAAENGVQELCDNIAADNPAIGLFRSEGFVEESTDESFVYLKKQLLK